MKALIVDDEPFAREAMEYYLKKISGVEIVGMAANIKEAHDLIISKQPQVVFLDVEMPGGNGFDLLNLFNEVPFYIIFTTAYDHYAIRAIKFSAIDYILKPCNKADLEIAVQKAEKRWNQDQNLNVKNLLHQVENSSEPQHIILPIERGAYESVPLDQIVHVQAEGSYSMFVLENGRKILTSKNLGEYEELFEGTTLVRIHKSSVVNLRFIQKYIKGDGGDVLLKSGEKLPISRSRKSDFIKIFMGK